MPIAKLAPGPRESFDADGKPPPFGHALKHYFALDDEYVNLNHGSYGSIPLPVTFAAHELALEMERNPDKFMRLTMKPLLNKSREAVADFIGAGSDEVVLIQNASHALNVVLRNFDWCEGDLLIGASTTYGAVSRTIEYLSEGTDRQRPTGHAIEFNFPLTHAQLVEKFRDGVRALKAAHPETQFTDVPPLSPGYSKESAARKNKVVAVIDSIASMPGVLLPWQEMVKICREEGVWSVVDAAHSLGQEPSINLSEARPDFWLSNCYKWLFTQRACAVLYVPKRNQHIIKSSIPTSHAYVSPSNPKFKDVGTNFIGQNEWTGCADPAPYLTVPNALAFRNWLGGEVAINAYCHQLALDGAQRLAELLGTRVMDPNGELTLSMSNILLPLPAEATKGSVYTSAQLAQVDALFRERLLLDWKTYAAVYFHAGAWWCRCSAQVYNEISDFEYLAKALKAVCKEAEDTVLAAKD